MTGPSTSAGTKPEARLRNCLALLVLCTSFVFSQSDTLRAGSDSLSAFRPLSPEPRSPSVSGTIELRPDYREKKSPWLAVGMSAVLPGSGQIYNTDYWKAPVIWGLGGYWVYEWLKLNDSYTMYRDMYSQSLEEFPPSGNSRYKDNRDFYRNERDKFAWFLAALYMVNLVDAYVGAHLYDFDVSPDLGEGGRIEPRVTATVRLRF